MSHEWRLDLGPCAEGITDETREKLPNSAECPTCGHAISRHNLYGNFWGSGCCATCFQAARPQPDPGERFPRADGDYLRLTDRPGDCQFCGHNHFPPRCQTCVDFKSLAAEKENR